MTSSGELGDGDDYRYYYTGLPEDKARMMELPGAEEGWPLEVESFGKGGQFETAPWHTYAVDGGNRDYPVQVFEYYSTELTFHVQIPRAMLYLCLRCVWKSRNRPFTARRN